jgi:lipoyl-dependent peroxiredoxin subunit D
MKNIEALREKLPDAARDIKINISNVLQPQVLDLQQTWGVAIASAYAARNPELTRALLLDATELGVEAGTIDDAKAAATLMALNNVYYRFRHISEKEVYSQKPARLRMMRLKQPASTQLNLELFSLAVSAINNCAACVRAHEAVCIEGGLSDDHVHDAVRIASVIHAMATGLELE